MKNLVIFIGLVGILTSFAFVAQNRNTKQDNKAETTLSYEKSSLERPCPICNGARNVICPTCKGEKYLKSFIKCEKCKGTTNIECGGCDGEGYLDCEIAPCINGYITYPCSSCYYKTAEEKKKCNVCEGTLEVKEMCSICKGKGRLKHPPCFGTGLAKCRSCNGQGENTWEYRCTNCDGVGYKKCDYCKGTGQVE